MRTCDHEDECDCDSFICYKCQHPHFDPDVGFHACPWCACTLDDNKIRWNSPKQVAAGYGLHPDSTILSQTCADFFLLERLTADRNSTAANRLKTLEDVTAKEFSMYMSLAVGGELRHITQFDYKGERDISHYLTTEQNYLLKSFLNKTTRKKRRQSAWAVWNHIVEKFGKTKALETAYECFEWPGWWGFSGDHTSSNYGGKRWATIARLALDFEEKRVSSRTFVNISWSIQHCGGSVFNKLYNVANLSEVLETQANDNYTGLTKFASAEVSNLWRNEKLQQRKLLMEEHDPTWFGLQQL